MHKGEKSPIINAETLTCVVADGAGKAVIMELKRDIYKELLKWKERDSGKVLELEGARQVGKTYILRKFAKEYEHSLYINMLSLSGQEFLKCLSEASEWNPGEPRIERPVHKALLMFDPEFQDTKDTLVVIDEIQESPQVYSMIRQFAREFRAHFVVTGSYLGKTREKEFFLSAGDTDGMKMETLTFPEFLDVFGKRSLYDAVDLYGSSCHGEYDELKEYFDRYLQIGGYPEAVVTYAETGELSEAMKVVRKLVEVFSKESQRYFSSELDMNVFDRIFHAISIQMLKEKKGAKDLTDEMSRIVFKEESGRITKRMVNSAVSWLYLSHQIGYAGKSVDCNYLDIVQDCRYYFCDCGVANCFLKETGAPQETVEGCLCENFAYLELVRRIRNGEIAGRTPWFGTDEESSGELDFFVRSLIDYKNYGLEIKRGNEIARTANKLLEKGRLDYVYSLKNTYGGIEGSKRAVPLYLAGRIPFSLGTKK